MMRFAFLDCTHADYHTLDALLRGSAVSTRRFILPEDQGILVGCGGDPAPQTAELALPPIAEGAKDGRLVSSDAGVLQDKDAGAWHSPFGRTGTPAGSL